MPIRPPAAGGPGMLTGVHLSGCVAAGPGRSAGWLGGPAGLGDVMVEVAGPLRLSAPGVGLASPMAV